MCLIGSGCVFKKSEYRFQKAVSKKKLDNGNQGTHPPVQQFHRGVLCAEQLKFIKPESVSSSVVIETPRRNFPSIRSRTAASLNNNSGSCKRVSILKETAPDMTSTKPDKRTSTVSNRVSITAGGVTYKCSEDVSSQVSTESREQVGETERKVSPTDSGMYSASSAKSVDWDTRTLTDPPTDNVTLTVETPSETEEEDTEGTLEGEEEEGEEETTVVVPDKEVLICDVPEV